MHARATIPESAWQRLLRSVLYGRDVDRNVKAKARLGLAIVDAITKGHGGSCAVTDTPGGGATFTIHLPPAAAELPAPVRAGDVLQRETSA